VDDIPAVYQNARKAFVVYGEAKKEFAGQSANGQNLFPTLWVLLSKLAVKNYLKQK